jgi:hypothetical protein
VATAFDLEMIADTEAAIRAYRAARLAFAANGAMTMYKTDTGQTTLTVERASPSALQKIIEGLENELACQMSRVYGNGTMIGKPAW